MTAPTPRRVTVVAPAARVDISLPPQSTVAELLPFLVRMTGSERAGTGWTLRRLGTDPLSPESTVAGAGVRDGELLYLHSRQTEPAPVLVDDVVDAIASVAAEPARTWRPGLSRRVGLASALVAFAGTAILVSLSRPPWPVAALVDGLLAVVLLGAAALARAFGDSGAGAVLAGAGLPTVLLGGVTAFAPGGDPSAAGAGPFGAGCALLALYAVLAAVAVADRQAWFVAFGVAGAIGAAAALAAVVTGASAPAAAVAAAVVLVLSPLLPMSALRLSRLPLPRVPADVAAFGRDDGPTRDADVADRTRTAAALLTGLLAAVAISAAGAAVALLLAGGGWARALAGMTGLAMVLRSRGYAATGQRGVLIAGGTVTLGATAVAVAVNASGLTAVALIGVVVGLGAVGLGYGVRAPAGQPSPYWARLLDVVEFLALVSLVPLAAAVTGLYQAVRSIGG